MTNRISKIKKPMSRSGWFFCLGVIITLIFIYFIFKSWKDNNYINLFYFSSSCSYEADEYYEEHQLSENNANKVYGIVTPGIFEGKTYYRCILVKGKDMNIIETDLDYAPDGYL